MSVSDFTLFKVRARQKLGLDLEGYRESQIQRRLATFTQKNGFADYNSLIKNLEQQPSRIRELVDYLDINVSEFFRNGDMFDWLRANVVPGFRGKSRVRAWSAGCSVGCEAYSLAIIFREVLPNTTIDIMATDVDSDALDQARSGRFSPDHIKGVNSGQLTKYFSRENEQYTINPGIKQVPTFKTHNLLKDPYPKDLDLIVCRNVVIYFTEEAKQRIFEGFAKSLLPGGVLFIGATESFFNARDFGLEKIHPCFYRKF